MGSIPCGSIHGCLSHLSMEFVCWQQSHPPSQPLLRLLTAFAFVCFPQRGAVALSGAGPSPASLGSEHPHLTVGLPPEPAPQIPFLSSVTTRGKCAYDFKHSCCGLSVRWDSQIMFFKVCHTQTVTEASASCPALAKNPLLHNKVLSVEKWHIPSQILPSWIPLRLSKYLSGSLDECISLRHK